MDKINNIESISGIDQFVLINHEGEIRQKSSNVIPVLADIVMKSAGNINALSSTGFRYIVFSRKDKKDLIIFPIGKHYLGMIKQESANTFALIDEIEQLLLKNEKYEP